MKCEKYLNLIDDLVEGELNEQASEQVNLHVFACPECASLYENLKREKEIFAHYLFDAEPPTDLWAKFQTKLETESVKTSPSEKILTEISVWKENLFGFLRLSPALAFAALVLTVGIGFVLFNFLTSEKAPQDDYLARNVVTENQSKSDEEAETTNSDENVGSDEKIVTPKNVNPGNGISKKFKPEAKSVAVKEIKKKAFSTGGKLNSETAVLTEEQLQRMQITALETEAAKQVEKVELLLRSFRNARSGEGGEDYDVAYEKEQARKLLDKNVRLRKNAETFGSLYTEEILSRVEPYLLDIANLESNPSAEKVRDIKERVKTQNIIASLQIY